MDKVIPAHHDAFLASKDLKRAQLLAARLYRVADLAEQDAEPNSTALLCIRNTKLSEASRLKYRANWISKLIQRRREATSAQLLELLEAVLALTISRTEHSDRPVPAQIRKSAAQLADQLFQMQPGRVRLSHYCSRRTAEDSELLAVEFFARGLEWSYIDGMADYLAAMYCVCRQADLRFRLTKVEAPKLRQIAADWISVTGLKIEPGFIERQNS
jgi:hypothetical protein